MKKGVTVDVAHVIDAANVGMRNPARDAHFVAKAFQQTFVARGFIRKKFQRHGLSQREVVGAVNFAHAAFAQQRDNAVAAGQQSAGQKASLVRTIVAQNSAAWKWKTTVAAAAWEAAEVDRGQIRRGQVDGRHLRRCSAQAHRRKNRSVQP